MLAVVARARRIKGYRLVVRLPMFLGTALAQARSLERRAFKDLCQLRRVQQFQNVKHHVQTRLRLEKERKR